MITAREQLAWLMWCYAEGYIDPIDRACHTNWMGDPDDELTEHDIKERDALLGMADEILELIGRDR